MAKKIKVRIQASQRVTWDKVVEMEKSDYDDLMRQFVDEPRMIEHPQASVLDGWLAPEDVDDWHEYDDIEITKV